MTRRGSFFPAAGERDLSAAGRGKLIRESRKFDSPSWLQTNPGRLLKPLREQWKRQEGLEWSGNGCSEGGPEGGVVVVDDGKSREAEGRSVRVRQNNSSGYQTMLQRRRFISTKALRQWRSEEAASLRTLKRVGVDIFLLRPTSVGRKHLFERVSPIPFVLSPHIFASPLGNIA